MREMVLACLLGPVVAFALAVGLAVTEDVVDSPYHPVTLLPVLAGRVHDVATAASDLVQELFAWFIAPSAAWIQRTLPAEATPQ